MSRIVLSTLLTVFVLLSLAACGSSGGDVTVGEADSGKQVEVKVGETVVVELPGNPTTGYMWEVSAVDEAVLKMEGEADVESDSDAVGAGGVIIMKFRAQASGQTNLELVYHQPWDEETPPEDTFNLTVVVK